MNVLIVIADPIRAAGLGKVLNNEGFTCQLAEGGFYALTMLERNRPDAIIASRDVLDMDGFDLYEIIRSDENLSKIAFVLLDDTVAAQLTFPNDVALPQDADGAAVAAALQPFRPLVFDAEKLKARPRLGKRGSQLGGTLEVLTLFDLVMSLTQNGRSGTLQLLIEDDEASISLRKGEVVHAAAENLVGEDAFKYIFIQAELADHTEFLFDAADDSVITPTIGKSVRELLFQAAVELDHKRAATAKE
ncbi:hypothetical protein BH24DEI2_BH24DEI2_14250 [soil metagenome]